MSKKYEQLRKEVSLPKPYGKIVSLTSAQKYKTMQI